jgi:hypothetical protein
MTLVKDDFVGTKPYRIISMLKVVCQLASNLFKKDVMKSASLVIYLDDKCVVDECLNKENRHTAALKQAEENAEKLLGISAAWSLREVEEGRAGAVRLGSLVVSFAAEGLSPEMNEAIVLVTALLMDWVNTTALLIYVRDSKNKFLERFVEVLEIRL